VFPAKAEGRFGKRLYRRGRCLSLSRGRLTYRYTSEEEGKTLRCY
jgi:hypothetical protein